MIDYTLDAHFECLTLLQEKNLFKWNSLLAFVQKLPYGRNGNRSDLALVLKEEQGTCSSKHAFIKWVADQNDIPNVELILGMYKMNSINTPGIGDHIEQANLSYIPEAHCYLKIEGLRKDFTNENAHISRIVNDIMKEEPILPQQVSAYKVEQHRRYIKKWIRSNNIELSFESVWSIREACIHTLAQQ